MGKQHSASSTNGIVSKNFDKDNIKSIFLTSILIILVLILSSRYSNGNVGQNLYYLLMFVLIGLLSSVFVKMIKSYCREKEIQNKESNVMLPDNANIDKQDNMIRNLSENSGIVNGSINASMSANAGNSIDGNSGMSFLGKKNTIVNDVGLYRGNDEKPTKKKVRFNTPLKDYEMIDNYQKDFFTFRDTLYQNSSNDFDYADRMNQEHEAMDSKKPLKGKIWDLYDELTKPDYSKVPVRYDNNLDTTAKYYPVSYKGPAVRLT